MNELDDFKSAVKAYTNLHDEITASSKQLRELRKQKDKIGDVIIGYMKQKDVDQCELEDGKLIRKKSRRTEALKKDHILTELVKLTGGDQARAEASLTSIQSMRQVKETEILTRTTKRSLAGSKHDLDEDDEEDDVV